MNDQTFYTAPKTAGVIAGRVFIYGLLILMALYFLLPFIVMVLTSLKTMEDIRTGNLISWPREFSLDAWKAAWGSACIAVECNGVKVYF